MTALDWLTESQWAALSAIGTLVSAVPAMLGLWFVGIQIRAATKVADIELLQQFLATAAQLERGMLEAASVEAKDATFFEYLNYLEFLAAGLKKGIFARLSREFIRDKLLDAFAMIEFYEPWQGKLEKAKSTPNALKYIDLFRRRNRSEIDWRKEMLSKG
ncbi:hypothetical protein ACO2RV_24325 [Ancylobacter sp. VNQ12]|uniref:hypothetical protein n=1 Tax=Ancylobacter sp. VNQ12 TaxID=3400920 RepID=UPI003C122236